MAEQQLTTRIVTNKSNGGKYGSADEYHDGSDDIIINKNSKKKWILQYLPLTIALIALIISLVNTGMLQGNKTDTTDAMNVAKSSRTAVSHLSRNFILSQFAMEQRIRSEGDSGITNVRQHTDGDEMYDDATFQNGAISAIHNHPDFINVAGMGEVSVVLNGVEFQTRHNDFNLAMPSTNSTEYGATEAIPMPDVPPAVLSYGDDIDGQITEMQEWFRAFKTQNKSHRYYPDYFQPILCYLEGTWIMDEGILEEPFESDRHSIDAETWNELHDKMRYMSNSGRKDPLENLAHLPSSIRNLVDDSFPVISNWEYRIVCTPLKNDIPTARLRVANDVSVQLFNSPLSRHELYYSRRARFELARYINMTDPDGAEYSTSYPNGYWQAGSTGWNFLDYIMEQAPGKDNYMANLTDYLPGSLYGDQTGAALHYIDGTELNSGYYNRFYQTNGFDAMQTTRHRRSYSDRYLFSAKTSQEKVSPVSMIWQTNTFDAGGVIGSYTEDLESRWSYAIPLEIIYTTPLVKWNPHGIQWYPALNNSFLDDPTEGSCALNKSYAGWWERNSYFTPAGFYTGRDEDGQGDTPQAGKCALDENGEPVAVMASGHWITMPRIGNDVGNVRQRYPIPPLHIGGHGSLKDIKALQKMLLDDEYDDPTNGLAIFGDERDRIYGFDVTVSGGGHTHLMHIPGWMVVLYWLDSSTDEYYNGSEYTMIADTDIANTHEHAILTWRWRESDNTQWHYVLQQCAFGTSDNPGNWMDFECADGHNTLVRGYL